MNYGGDWTVVDGYYQNYIGGGSKLAYIEDLIFDDFEYSVDIVPYSGEVQGIAFGRTEGGPTTGPFSDVGGSFFVFGFSTYKGLTDSLGIFNYSIGGENWWEVIDLGWKREIGKSYQFTVKVSGNNVQGFLDGVKYIVYIEDNYMPGNLGLWHGSGGYSYYDNVKGC